jgi:hypothetical protein
MTSTRLNTDLVVSASPQAQQNALSANTTAQASTAQASTAKQQIAAAACSAEPELASSLSVSAHAASQLRLPSAWTLYFDCYMGRGHTPEEYAANLLNVCTVRRVSAYWVGVLFIHSSLSLSRISPVKGVQFELLHACVSECV